jgi:hypothetical protein
LNGSTASSVTITVTTTAISTEEFPSATPRSGYSVLANLRLTKRFGVALPDWRNQLQSCFAPERFVEPVEIDTASLVTVFFLSGPLCSSSPLLFRC